MKVMIMAGEASGDMHGAFLAKALKEKEPDVELIGTGSTMMQEAGVRLLVDMARYSTVGVWEALKNIRALKSLLQEIASFIKREQPDVVVLIDYPGFHLEVAKILKQERIRSVYYFCPSAWAWGKGRAKKVAERISRVASVFPFEAKVYEEAGADVEFIGHPLLDIVKVAKAKAEFITENNLPANKTLLGLLPGSREQEIELLLPLLLEAAELIKNAGEDCHFVLPLSHTIKPEKLRAFTERHPELPLTVIPGQSYEVMAYSSLILVSSGTATLEAACLGTPMVIVYKVAGLTWFLGKIFVKLNHIGLPNIIAGREVVPEFLQDKAVPVNVSAAALKILRNDRLQKRMRQDLQEVKEKLGSSGAVLRAADLVLRVGRMK